MSIIKQARKKVGLNQAEVASRLGVPTATYAQYEQGKRFIPREIANAMSRLYRIPMDEFFLPERYSIRTIKDEKEHEKVQIDTKEANHDRRKS